ncbi:[FeFe] hydrogenase H-cluster radical SAM maturase HydG [Pelotomaculum isophthalicicum JI]|uniref:[FeFe] hydrogenase H-cluster radical SAM maturase HydG n=1 Tax=Pelotomaculum isophthalicicum JI TaxID=947010 RepID=A0A9X4JTB1_9FIRM|nr:[FeFe] hydrogenase H-cluster radical SAM maturase HydG [Pelotomaculum isophthalicicum]MDF9408469.1 [FeFe] hydrogenase H-cluster radical SAM maturase HydG [Pelotomaculum isophthalicicum JI]
MAISKADFIDDALIVRLLNEARNVPREAAQRIIKKAGDAKGLAPEEAAVLLQVDDPDLLAEIYRVASKIKENIYGRRLVFFAPLYISNYCVNNCVYCGYRRDNNFRRHRLSRQEIIQEVKVLEDMGHKRLAVECGEDPVNCPIDYVLESIDTIYSVKEKRGSIRRVNVNIAATTVENYKLLKEAKIGTYILFQETYHRPTYAAAHPSGHKSGYDWHTCAMDRAMEGGIDDVGLGVLFGLYDYKYEVMAILLHALHLEEVCGVGPHTISVPRLKPAAGMDLNSFPYLVPDADFKKVVAIIRLAVPYTGMLISTRERPVFRDELLSVGISQLSAGSSTGVGGYCKDKMGISEGDEAPQFKLEDLRSLDEVVRSVCRSGYIPSFCTACYRSGRTGDRFMPLAKSGEIQNVCQPNAILTFKEFLLDYASPETRQVGEETIARHLELVGRQAVAREVERRLEQITGGARDLYF